MDRASFALAGLRVLPTPWDKHGNLDKLVHFARRAAGESADVVVTPEGFLEGYVWNDELPTSFSRAEYLALGEAVDGPLLGHVGALASELRIYLVVGFAERRGEQMFNSVAVFSPDGAVVSLYSKMHTADDEPYNTLGGRFAVVETPWGTWGTLICMDRQLPETARVLAVRGAQLILVPAWGMYGEMNDALMRTRAFENGVHVAFVHPRRCLIIDPGGTVVAQDRGDGDEVVVARITLSRPGARSAIRHRRPELYGDLGGPETLRLDRAAPRADEA